MKSTNYTTSKLNQVNRKIYGIIGAIASLVIPFIIMYTDPHVESSQSICPMKLLTGLPCPGCGITKSFISLYKGDIIKSLSYNFLGPLAVFLCFATIIVLMIEIITGREYFNRVLYSKKVAIIAGISLGIYHLFRTIYFISTHTFVEILSESIWVS